MADYNMKIPRELADTFEKFIEKNPELGYRKISQYILYILQQHAREILSSNLEIKPRKEKSIRLKEGTYTKDQLKKLLEED